MGRVGEQMFLNNVSLGNYARLVHRRERRRQRREAFARLRALLLSLRDHRRTERFVIDGQPVRASVVLVANNEYKLDLLSIGERMRVDEGTLAIYAANGLRRLRWTERKSARVRIEMRRNAARVAIDGEPANLESPLELRVEPGALRLLVPETATWRPISVRRRPDVKTERRGREAAAFRDLRATGIRASGFRSCAYRQSSAEKSW